MDRPTVAVVVPAYEDPDGVAATLDSLLSQETDRTFPIHVVDNDSSDHTPDVVRSYVSDRITLLHETDIQSSYAARNTGIRNTGAEILAFVDADMSVPGDWLESALHAFESTDVDYMGCNVELTLPDKPSLPARYDHHTGFPVKHYLMQQHFAPTCCLFVRRSVFREVGLFDPRLISAGDKEFGNRVHDASYDMHYADAITVYHPTRDSLRELVAKDIRVGRGLCQLQRYHTDRYGSPGMPPRPSGAKSPKPSIPIEDRLTFGAFGTLLTGVRAMGYFRELISPSDAPDIEEIPTLD